MNLLHRDFFILASFVSKAFKLDLQGNVGWQIEPISCMGLARALQGEFDCPLGAENSSILLQVSCPFHLSSLPIPGPSSIRRTPLRIKMFATQLTSKYGKLSSSHLAAGANPVPAGLSFRTLRQRAFPERVPLLWTRLITR